MKKIVLLLLAFLVAIAMDGTYTEAKSCKQGNFKFEYEIEDEGAWITKITPLSKKGIGTLKIPKKLEGKKVVKLGAFEDEIGVMGSPDNDYNLFGVYTSKEDDSIQPIGLWEKVRKIKTIRIPESVKFITQSCFKNIQNGKNINIPRALAKEPLDGEGNTIEGSVVEQFTKVKWNQITVSPKNKKFKVENSCLLSKDGKILHGFVQKREQIVIPGTVRRIAGFWGDYNGASTIVIPKGVKKIEKGALSARKAVTVKIAKGNKRYAVKDDCVYSKVSGRLVLGYVKNDTLKVPDTVRLIDCELAKGYVGPTPKKVIIPKSVKEIHHLLAMTFPRKFTVIMKGKNPPKVVDYTLVWAKSVTIYVPKGCKKKYIDKWKTELESWENEDGPQFTILESGN